MKPGGKARRIGIWSAAAITTAATLTGLTALSVNDSEPRQDARQDDQTHAAAPQPPLPVRRPNIVVITTDDQDVASLSVMPNVRRLLAEQGTTYANSFVSTPLCAPSRASFLTGQYAHNHGITDNSEDTGGGYEGLRKTETLPVWLTRAGYSTAHIGKFLNGYGAHRRKEIPPGWTDWYGLVGPSTYTMFGYTINENGRLRTYGDMHTPQRGPYQTDMLAAKAADYITRRSHADRPFFLSVAPLAPHTELPAVSGQRRWTAPRPAPRHQTALPDARVPRTPAFNEADVSDKPQHIQRLAPQNPQQLDHDHRRRLQSLLAVDDMVGRIVESLRSTGQLDNTLIFFTSDNGMLEGDHRINFKEHPYERSIRVPLIVRGPGVQRGKTEQRFVTTVDLTATVLAAAQAKPGIAIDGRSFLGTPAPSSRDMLVETGPRNSTTPWYTAIRTERHLYVEHSTGERELYDLLADPYQLDSRHADPALQAVRDDLAKRLHLLRSCAGQSCP